MNERDGHCGMGGERERGRERGIQGEREREREIEGRREGGRGGHTKGMRQGTIKPQRRNERGTDGEIQTSLTETCREDQV